MAPRRDPQERLAQRGLADTALAGDEDDLPVALDGGVEGADELLHRRFPADEDRQLRCRRRQVARGFDDRSDEDVAALDDAADEVGAGGVVAEGAANLADEHLDVVGVNVGVGPDRAEQGIATNDVPGPVDEDPQDLEGFMSERNPGMSAPERPPLGVNPERSEIFHVGGLSPVAGECGALTDGAAPILPKYYRYDAGATRGLTRLLLQSNFQPARYRKE